MATLPTASNKSNSSIEIHGSSTFSLRSSPERFQFRLADVPRGRQSRNWKFIEATGQIVLLPLLFPSLSLSRSWVGVAKVLSRQSGTSTWPSFRSLSEKFGPTSKRFFRSPAVVQQLAVYVSCELALNWPTYNMCSERNIFLEASGCSKANKKVS